jgi:hypothetical protein
MADRYWVGGGSSANWDATGNTNWGTASATQDNASVPVASDNVFFDGVGVGAANCTISAAAVCRSANFTGYVNTLTHNAGITWTIGDATAGTGNILLKFVAGMTYTLGSATSAITFASTSATQQTIDIDAKTVGNFNLGSTGNYQLASDITIVSIGTWTCATAATFDANGKTITMPVGSGSNRTFAGGGKTYALVTSSVDATLTITGANTFATLTLNGAPGKTAEVALAADQTVSGTLTGSGDSTVERILIRSNTTGTARTITAATVTMSNVDLEDITGAGAGSWNLSAITGNSGDCGGNSGITFTTGVAQAATGTASFAWSTHGWTTRVPLPQDDVTIANAFVAGRVITADMPRLGKNIDFTGVTGAVTYTQSVNVSFFGSLTFAAGMAMGAATFTITAAGRGSHTLTSAGKDLSSYTPQIDAGAGSYTLQDALSAAGKNLNIQSGTFDSNNFNVTCVQVAVTNVALVSVIGGTSTWTLSSTSNPWNLNGVSLPTISMASSTIVMTSVTTASFLGGTSRSYGKVKFTGAGGGTATINNNCTIDELTVVAPRPLRFTAGINVTINRFVFDSRAGAVITWDTTGAASTVTSNLYMQQFNFLSLTNILAAGTAKWYAGHNSTNVSGNTGWQLRPGSATEFVSAGNMVAQ